MLTKDKPRSTTMSEDFIVSLFTQPEGERVLTCLQCGTCVAVCPFGEWMEFPPRKIIGYARMNALDEVLDTDSVWMCVSCYACSEMCPSKIPLTETLMTRVKEELLLSGKVPAELHTALRNSQRYGNPLGKSPRKRADWTKDIDPPVRIMAEEKRPVDVLWFVGDYASYHPRVQNVTKAFAKVLNALGIKFGILGPEEVSDGDSQRLSGEIGLFEVMALKNWRAFSKYKFNEVITTDPHAFNALKNEYPRVELSIPVRHYTQFLVEHLDQLSSSFKNEIRAIVAYHDACYLGRANGIYEEPREILKAIPGIELVEMAHNRSNSLCCGGGGGGMWLDGFQWEKSHQRLSEWRVQEAVQAWPDLSFSTPFMVKPKRKARVKEIEEIPNRILAVACPYEAPRFEDATKVVPEANNLVIKDIAELLAEAMGL